MQCTPLQTHGITLIALIITIILLLILAGVTIHFTLGENGILKNAEIAVEKYKNAENEEQTMLNEFTNEAQNIINGSGKNELTLAKVTNANIGDYIDLGNNPLDIYDTTKNWRIFYKEGNTVYVILADFLPSNTGYTTTTGLKPKTSYTFYYDNREEFITILKDSTKWNVLTNSISGAKAVGSPTVTQIKKSWDAKNPDNTLNISEEIVESESFDYIYLANSDSLYVPHKEVINNEIYGYWLASKHSFSETCVIYYGEFLARGDEGHHFAIRPVISLPMNTKVEHTGNIWTVKK